MRFIFMIKTIFFREQEFFQQSKNRNEAVMMCRIWLKSVVTRGRSWRRTTISASACISTGSGATTTCASSMARAHGGTCHLSRRTRSTSGHAPSISCCFFNTYPLSRPSRSLIFLILSLFFFVFFRISEPFFVLTTPSAHPLALLSSHTTM